MHKVFKTDRKGDSIRTAYFHSDGHVVVVFERYELGRHLTYVKIAESIGVRPVFQSGRIIFKPAQLVAIAALPNPQVGVYMDNRSDTTKALGMRVDSVTVDSGVGHFSIHDTNVLSGAAEIQLDKDVEVFADVARAEEWSTYPVLKVFPNETAKSA